MGKDFLPAFHEETALVTTGAAPGHLAGRNGATRQPPSRAKLRQVPEVNHVGRRIGRAERSDHVVPVSNAGVRRGFQDRSPAVAARRRRSSTTSAQRVRTVPGSFSVGVRPLSHRISHMLSGVTAPVAVKVFGPDLRASPASRRPRSRQSPRPSRVSRTPSSTARRPFRSSASRSNRERAAAYGIAPGHFNDALASSVRRRGGRPYCARPAHDRSGHPPARRMARESGKHRATADRDRQTASASRSRWWPTCARPRARTRVLARTPSGASSSRSSRRSAMSARLVGSLKEQVDRASQAARRDTSSAYEGEFPGGAGRDPAHRSAVRRGAGA